MRLETLVLQLGLVLSKLDLVDARSNAFHTNLDDIAVFQPNWRLFAHRNTLWTVSGQLIIFSGNTITTYVPVKIKSPGRRVVPSLRAAIVFATPKI